MNNVLESFIRFDEKLVENLNVKNSISASYLDGDNSIQLDLEKPNLENEEYYLSPVDDSFNLAKDNLKIQGCVNIENIRSLFGKDDPYSRVALDDTIIGVSLNAYSLVSRHNITKPIGEISLSDDNEKSITYNIGFPSGSLADKLFISINLYVKEARTKSNIYATIDGTILGPIYTACINLEGTGSIFPIRIISNKDEPLWFVDLNYEDLNDAFCQNTICLNINSSHVDFDKIGSQDITVENNAMWKEVLSSFFTQVILGLNEREKSDLYVNESFNEGTIGLFLQYIVQSFNIDKSIIDNPTLLNKKILVGLDELMK